MDSGTDVFVMTLSLSTQTVDGSMCIGIPIILNVYRSPSRSSVPILSTMESDPKVELSTVFCPRENNTMCAVELCDQIGLRPLCNQVPCMSSIHKHVMFTGFYHIMVYCPFVS